MTSIPSLNDEPYNIHDTSANVYDFEVIAERGFSQALSVAANVVLKTVTGNYESRLDMIMVPMAHKPFQNDFSIEQLMQKLLGFAVLFMYSLPYYNMVFTVTKEKETRTRESMRMMGVRTAPYWLSWYIYFVFINTVISVLSSLTLHWYFFKSSDVRLVFALLWLYGQSLFGQVIVAQSCFSKAKEAGDAEMIEKMSKRTVRVSREQSQEVMRLARLLGLPVFEAPCEAEASCAALCKAGLVYAAASEDMDTLCFSCPKLARNLMAPASQGKPILEFDFERCLKELELTWDQFIDVCIMCGCDYCDSIKGIGPVKALQLIKKHGCIEKMLLDLDKEKYVVPEDWPFDEARKLFKNPDVVDTNGLELKFTQPDEEGVVDFLVKEKQFSEDRVRNALKKLKAAKGKSSQNRLESFFGAAFVKSSTVGKRKEPEKGKGGKNGKGPGKKSKGVTKRK